jgi:NADPH2:quinone reductase
MKIEGIGALVVGGASGLGAATAKALADRGANVAIADLKPPEGGDAPFFEMDVQDEDKVKAGVEGAVEALGELRFVVNCAGVGWAERTIGRQGPANPLPFEITLGVNLIGMYRVLRHSAWAMSQNEPDEGGERGAFVMTASIAGYDGQIGQTAYAASKAGIIGLTLPAARDLSRMQIRRDDQARRRAADAAEVRAALVEQIGEPPVVGEIGEPERGEGQALVQVTAAAINPVDISISKGLFHGGTPDVPYVMGREGVGRVVEGDKLDPGTQIWFQPPSGGSFAELALADESQAVVLPEGTDHSLAAALGIAGLTGWLAVEWRAHLRGGERVLVLGATGVVGLVAVQAARILGASRIVAAGRDAGSLEAARAAGAHETVVLPADAEAFRAAAGGAPDVVIDPLWGEPAAQAVEAAGFSARVVQLGQSAGAEATLRSGAIRGKSLAIVGFTLGHVPQDKIEAAYRRLIELSSSGDLSIERETLPLDWAGEAWKRQQDSPHRKLVLVP